MTIHHREAKYAKDIAIILRGRGRTIITAPPRSGKTTELIRYAEERYPNGRFIIVCAREEDKNKIIHLHWLVANGISYVDVVAKRLLGEKLKGEEVNEPTILFPPHVHFPSHNHCIPVFCDDFNLLPNSAQRAILKRQLFIAAVQTKGENDGTQES